MSVKLNFDKGKLAAKLKRASEEAVFMVSEQALKDCNYYAREQTGELIRSSVRASDLKKGRLIWNTKYAKKMYYTGEPRTNVNPNAAKMWGEKAKAAHVKEWAAIAKLAVKKAKT